MDTSIDYYNEREEQDPVLDPSSLDPLENNQKEDIDGGISTILEESSNNGLKCKQYDKLCNLLSNHIGIFDISFSSGPPTKIEPLRIALTHDVKSVRVLLWNYW